MSEIQQNRYDQLLRRVADLKGPGSKVNDALGELFPTIDVENVPLELQLLSGARICMGIKNLSAGGAGTFNDCLLMNPVDSGVIARVIDTQVASTSVNVNLGLTQNVTAFNGVEAYMDGRVFGEGTVCKLGASNNKIVSGPAFYLLAINSDFLAFWDPPLGMAVLTPGSAFIWSNSSANNFLTVSVQWLERQAEPSELNL